MLICRLICIHVSKFQECNRVSYLVDALSPVNHIGVISGLKCNRDDGGGEKKKKIKNNF